MATRAETPESPEAVEVVETDAAPPATEQLDTGTDAATPEPDTTA